ncbi:hypothetical protein GCM10025791_50060 [Halioxenophilus aromaticivorans]|uniref:Integrase n=1 Tax=Halioxenophilus aromaticivorans TaxID=1306992 RepID=A0AAV3UAV6_9ALTE
MQTDGLIRAEEIELAAHKWAYREPAHFKLRDAQKTKAHFISIAKQWLGFMNRLRPAPEPLYVPFIEAFADYMYRDRGLSDMTIRSECGHIRAFLSRYAVNNDLSSITIKQIDEAIARKGYRDGCTRNSIGFYAASLRAFFRYVEMNGWCSPGLAAAIIAPRVYQHELVPSGPPWGVVQQILASCSGDRPVCIRDRAILMLFAIYGLRSGEVQRLRLEDLDWDQERINIVRPKPRTTQQYPLIRPVGEAILRYLKEVRLQRPSRYIFLTLRAPYGPLSGSALWKVVSDRLRPLGVPIRHYGPHSIRHACATHLLANGLSMKEIGDHLGHRDPASTSVYAKVDIAGLREVAEFDLGGLL